MLDCFMGSGTAGLMSWDMKRNFVGIEIDKLYFDEAKERFENFTQREAMVNLVYANGNQYFFMVRI